MGKAIRESSFRTRLGERSKLGMPIRTPSKRTLLVCVSTTKIGMLDDHHLKEE